MLDGLNDIELGELGELGEVIKPDVAISKFGFDAVDADLS
jgi:hypothetical protein